MKPFNPFERGPLQDPITAITGGIGLVGSLVGGKMQSDAAGKAADYQAAAAEKAGKQVTDAAAAVNPVITGTAATGGADVIAAADRAGAGVTSAADRANAEISPYRVAGEQTIGSLQRDLADGGSLNRMPTAADIQIDPGYAFREQQAQLALARKAAATGTTLSGGSLVDLNREVQGSASQEFTAAYNRWRQSNQDRYDRLFGVSRAGQEAAGAAGQNLIGAARYAGDTEGRAQEFNASGNSRAAEVTGANTIGAADKSAEYLTQGANARAAGVVGKANAWSGAIQGGAGAVTSALNLHQILKNPQYGRFGGGGIPGVPLSLPGWQNMPGMPTDE